MVLRRLPLWKEAARNVSKDTGIPSLFHIVDGYYCHYRYGCSALQYEKGQFYRLRPFERRKTYTIERAKKLRLLLNESNCRHLCANKNEFNGYYASYIKRKWLYAKDADVETIRSFIMGLDRVIVKPNSSMKGRGVSLMDRSSVSQDSLEHIAGSNYILEQYIVQHPDMDFGSKSVNTVRLTTLVDRTGGLHFLKAMVRCGIGESIVDNYNAGGVNYPVDLELGVIEGTGTTREKGSRIPIYCHPGTETIMLGKRIPYWKETLEMVHNAALKEPRLRFIGWDVVITPDGPELLEGNTLPGPSLLDYVGAKRGIYGEIMAYLKKKY